MANVTLWGASYSNVPSITVPKTGGGTASFTDVTDTTAAASDVATGKYFYTAAGVRTQGTNSGGGGGSSDVVMGTLSVASNVNTSTNTQITTTTAIGFTPTKFFFWKSDRTATSNHVHQASFITIGSSYYIRNMTRYSNSSLSTSGNANNWTTQTAGYLYYSSSTIYFRSSSSYILSAGTWHWVAVK